MVSFNRVEYAQSEPDLCPCCRAPLTESGPALVVIEPVHGPTRFIGPFDNWQDAADWMCNINRSAIKRAYVESLIPPDE